MNWLPQLLACFQPRAGRRQVVFWYDPEGERDLEALAAALQPHQIALWVLSDHNVFQTKYQLEMADPDGDYLVYAPWPKPAAQDNWLLDMLLYGTEFRTDDLALLRSRLHLDQVSREFLVTHQGFFKSQDRVRRLQRLIPEHSTEDDVTRGMLAVLTRISVPTPSAILGRMLWREEPALWAAVTQYFGEDAWWQWVHRQWGIPPRVRTRTALREIITAAHLWVSLGQPEGLLGSARETSQPHACRILYDEWLANAALRATMRPVVEERAQRWQWVEYCQGVIPERLVRCDTGPFIDQVLQAQSMAALRGDAGDPALWQELAAARRTHPWGEEQTPEYQALEAAWRLEDFRRRWQAFAPLQPGENWVKRYSQQLAPGDYAYRQCATAVQQLHYPEWLQDVWMRLDNWYTHHFLEEVAHWAQATLQVPWFIPNVPTQTQFFDEFVAWHVAKSSERIFVIISDAFRYEAGLELQERRAQRGVAEHVSITAVQAALPTYTQLGMASLLPGFHLQMTDRGVVLRDGKSTQGMDHRNAVLQAKDPAFHAWNLSELMAWPVTEGIEHLKGLRVVYLYQNIIDARGDKAASEGSTFAAVAETLDALEAAVKKLVQSYQAARIFITADHGFLFQIQALPQWNQVGSPTGNIIDHNHRFVLGTGLSAPPGTRKLTLDFLGMPDREAVIPEGLARFGGAGGGIRFVHGGAMPQEAVIPVIEYRPLRGKAVQTGGRVTVSVVTQERIITAYTFKVRLFQEERVSPHHPRRIVQVALYRGDQRLSNAVSVVCDAAGDVTDRQYEVTLTIREGAYPPGMPGQLRLSDVSGSAPEPYQEIPVEFRIYGE